MKSITLRDYQKTAIQNIRHEFNTGKKTVILQLPTGAGKTIIFTAISKQANEKGSTILVITDRKELLTQADGAFDKFGITPTLLTANTKTLKKAEIYIGMVETIKRRLTKPNYVDFVQSFSLIIIDESHKQSFDRLFEAITPFQYVIGATATPYRTGKMKPLKEYYDSIVIGEQITELITCNFLSPAVHYGVPIAGLDKVKITAGDFDQKQMGELYDAPELYGGVIENYKAHASGRKTLLFAATVRNSEIMAREFNSAGISAMHLDAETPKSEREAILEDFKNDKFMVLCNVGILTTGYDEPSVSCIITYRATRSLPLWLQMCGRGSRIYENKRDFIILDFGENAKRHGLWDEYRTWSLENAKPPKKQGMALVKDCPACGAMIPARSVTCPVCGFEIPVKRKDESPIKVMLEKMTGRQINNFDWDSVYELEQARVAKGYKIGWVLHRLKSYQEFLEYEKIKNYKRGWAKFNYERYARK